MFTRFDILCAFYICYLAKLCLHVLITAVLFFRHGVVRTDEFILNDPALSFKDVFKNKRPYVNSPHFMQSPGASMTPSKFKSKFIKAVFCC